jgi:hypothetical protein
MWDLWCTKCNGTALSQRNSVLSWQYIIPSMLYHRRYIILATDSVVKQQTLKIIHLLRVASCLHDFAQMLHPVASPPWQLMSAETIVSAPSGSIGDGNNCDSSLSYNQGSLVVTLQTYKIAVPGEASPTWTEVSPEDMSPSPPPV